MKKISNLMVIILAIALALAACGGNIKSKSDTNTTTSTGTDDPLVVFDEGDMESEDENDSEGGDGDGENERENAAVPPVFWPTAIGDVTVECGRDFSKAINTKGGTGEISWKVNGLPAWAKAEPSESTKNILRVSGLLPFEGCDVNTHKVSLKVCGSKGSACSENSFNIKTKIHGISIKTALSNTGAVMDAEKAIPKLEAAGGSGSYTFTTTIPKELIGESQDRITNDLDIKFTPKKIGTHTIKVVAMDKVFEGRQEAIAEKMGITPDQVGTATREFKVNVKEDGFIVNASLTDSPGTQTDTAQSNARQDENKSYEVPYNGKIKFFITGKGEKYFLTIKSTELPTINKSNFEIAREAGHEINFSDFEIAAKVAELATPINMTITAKNESGQSETLKMERISFAKDPCESLDVELTKDFHQDGYVTIERGSASEPVVSLSVKGGKGPFFWYIPSEMMENIKDLDTSSKVDTVNIEASGYTVDLQSNWNYYDEESQTQNRETIKITRDTAYANINDKLGWSDKKDLDSFTQTTSGGPIRVYEILDVSVTDNGCMKKVTREIPITVEIPKPNQEMIKNVKFAHHVGITDTYKTDGQSRAKMTLYNKNHTSLGKTSNKNIAAWCGESYWVNRWNWPCFDKPIDSPTNFLDDISHLELQLKQPGDATDHMEYHLHRFYIVGKNWVYYDDKDGKSYKYNIGDGHTDIVCIAIGDNNKCPEKPESDSTKDSFNHNTGGATSNGKWYLRCDPSVETSTWCGNEDNIKFEADTDMNACATADDS